MVNIHPAAAGGAGGGTPSLDSGGVQIPTSGGNVGAQSLQNLSFNQQQMPGVTTPVATTTPQYGTSGLTFTTMPETNLGAIPTVTAPRTATEVSPPNTQNFYTYNPNRATTRGVY